MEMTSPPLDGVLPSAGVEMGRTAIAPHDIVRYGGDRYEAGHDQLAVERLLQISVSFRSGTSREIAALVVTLRTPGLDEALAMGYIYAEGIAHHPDEIERVTMLSDDHVLVHLADRVCFQLESSRMTVMHGSCGMCGRRDDGILSRPRRFQQLQLGGSRFTETEILNWKELLDQAQSYFSITGGMHAAAYVESGSVLYIAEDIGRHNALDKVVGLAWQEGKLPLSRGAIVLSGRAGYEMVDKAVMAGATTVASVGAASTMAVDLAANCGVTLIGFLRNSRFTVYHGAERLMTPPNEHG